VLHKLKRAVARAVLDSRQVACNLNRWSVIKRLAVGVLYLLTYSHSVWAENSEVDFNKITLPTDLVAAISEVEDDIAISNPIQNSPVTTTTQKIETSSLETTTSTAVPVASALAVSETEFVAATTTSSADTESGSESAQQGVAESVSAGTEALDANSLTSAPATIDQVEKVIVDQPAQEQVVKFNTEIPAADPESIEPISTLVATADSTDQATASGDIPAAELVPSKTTEQLTQQQDERINEDEIILTWATAWSNNDVEQYLSFYSNDFEPDDPSLDRSRWEQMRRERLQNKNIQIIVSNAEVYRVDNEITEVRFTQRYTSKSYRDRVIKSIEMKETPSGWKFISERTIEKLPFE